MRFHHLSSLAAGILAGLPIFASAPGLWIDVPFVKQEAKGCGAAAISMVMQYWSASGHEAHAETAEPGRIMSELFVEGSNGIRGSDMRRYFEEHGYRAFAFRGSWEDLSAHLEKGRPLVVSIGDRRSRGPLHYVVVAGMDPVNGFVYVNDPAERKMLRMERSTFLKKWRGMDYWTLLAVPSVPN
jgi:predicted double-glycine peptidase